MKISLVSEHANPLATPGSVDAGGQNVHVAALARALATRGHTVTVFTRRDDASVPTRVPLAAGVEVVHLTAGPPERVPKDELLPHMDELARGLAAEWAKRPPDIVHSHFWMSGLASIRAVAALNAGARGAPAPGDAAAATPPPSRAAHLPIAHTFHALGSVKRRFQGAADTSPPQRAWLEPQVGRAVDVVIATCLDEVHELEALGITRNRTAIAPCGVDLAEFRATGPTAPRGSQFRVLSVGRLVPRKGVDLVIEAIALLRDRGVTGVELEVVGSSGGDEPVDPEITRLSSIADRLGVADAVNFRHRVPREHVPGLLRSADVVVCAPWYEPFGIVPLESMACGVPVVAAAVGGLADTVVDGVTGVHVPPRDAGAIADALADLFAAPARRAAMGRAGRARVEAHYSWQRVAELTEGIYESLVSGRRERSPRAREMAS